MGLLLEASALGEWQPLPTAASPAARPPSDVRKLVLGEQVPRLLRSLESAVLDAILLDTAAELSRLDITKAWRSEASLTAAPPPRMEAGEEEVLAYLRHCGEFEDRLRSRYL